MSTVIKHKQFNNYKSWTMDLCGRPLTIEVGKVAKLASASAMVKYGETTVLVAVTVSPRPRDGIDFFPLSVDFEEKLTLWAASPAASTAVRAAPVRRASSPAVSSTGPSVPCSPLISATTCPSCVPS